MGISNAERKLQELLAQGYENELVEFKEAKNQYDFNKLGKYFSALSNEANLQAKKAAFLVFGVRDTQLIVGTKFRIDAPKRNSLKAEIANHTTGNIIFIEIHEVITEE